MASKKRKAINEPSEVDKALESLSGLMQKREKELDEREEELRKAEEKFDAERTACYGVTTPTDVLQLNVGGKPMAVLRRTLTLVEGSMLASRFSGRWDESLEKDENGHFFIDQEYGLFVTMVNYLRQRTNETDLYPVRSPTFASSERRHDFYRMLEFYGMSQGVYPNKFEVIYENDSNEEDTIEMLGPLHVNAREWCTLQLTHHGHDRQINMYEITLGSAQRVQMGWSDGDASEYGTSNGVGDVSSSLALDLSRSCFLQDGSRTDINGLELKEGTVIRAESCGNKWFINGKLVASGNETDNAVHVPCDYDYDDDSRFKPVISVKGELKVSAITYAN